MDIKIATNLKKTFTCWCAVLLCAVLTGEHDAYAQERIEIIPQIGHGNKITAVAFSPSADQVASASEDNTIKIWRKSSGHVIHTLVGHTKKVNCLIFSPGGSWLISGATDDTIRIWNTTSGELRATRDYKGEPINELAITDDGKTLFAAAGHKVKVMDFLTGDQSTSYDAGGLVTAFTLSRDNRYLAAAAWISNHITVWDMTTGRAVSSFYNDKEVMSLKFTPDNRQLLSAARYGKINYWNLGSSQIVRSITAEEHDVHSIDISPDGHKLVSGGTSGWIKLWNLKSGVKLWDLNGVTRGDSSTTIESVVFSPDGNQVLAGNYNGDMNLVDTHRGSLEREYFATSTPITGMDVSSQDQWIAATTYGPTITLWDTNRGTPTFRTVKNNDSLNAIKFNHAGTWLATGGKNKLITVMDTNSDTVYAEYPGPTRNITDIVIAPYDNWVAAGGGTEIRFWNTQEGKDLGAWNLSPTQTDQTLQNMEGLQGQLGIFAQALLDKDIRFALSPDGNWLAGGSIDRSVEIANTSTWKTIKPLGELIGSEGAALAFSPDSNTLAAGGLSQLNLWHRPTSRTTVLQTDVNITSLAFDPGGAILAAGHNGGNITLWNTSNDTRIRTLQGHSNAIHNLAFAKNGNLLVSGSTDGTIRVWSVKTGEELLTLIELEEIGEWLATTPEGFFDGTRRTWKMVPFRFPSEPQKLYEPEQFFSQFYQPSLLAEIFREGKAISEILRDQGDPRAQLDISQYRNSSLPVVRITNKSADPVSSRSITLTIAAEDTGSSLRDLRVFRNQTLVHLEHGVLKPEPGSKTYRLDVPVKLVAGENEITAYVFNHDNIKSKDAQIVLQGAESLKRKGTAYVLAVGINLYSNARYNLNYSVADAKAMNQQVGASLKNLGQYSSVVSVSLLDHQATKANILIALSRLAGVTRPLPAGAPAELNKIMPAQPEDSVIMFYAGHGKAKGDRYYLLPHYLNAISDQDLEAAFEKVDAGSIMLVLDACQSGQALEADERRRGPMNSRGLAQLAYEKGMYILAAAQSDEAAKEFKRLGHGLLTYTLLEEGLKQGRADTQPSDKQLTAREWLDYAVARVPQLTAEAIAQFRSYKGRDIDFEEQTVTTQVPRAYYRRETGDQWIVDKQ